MCEINKNVLITKCKKYQQSWDISGYISPEVAQWLHLLTDLSLISPDVVWWTQMEQKAFTTHELQTDWLRREKRSNLKQPQDRCVKKWKHGTVDSDQKGMNLLNRSKWSVYTKYTKVQPINTEYPHSTHLAMTTTVNNSQCWLYTCRELPRSQKWKHNFTQSKYMITLT